MNDLMCEPKQARPLKAASAKDSTAAAADVQATVFQRVVGGQRKV